MELGQGGMPQSSVRKDRANRWFPVSATVNLRMCTSFPGTGLFPIGQHSFPRSARNSALSRPRTMGASVTLPVAIASSLGLISRDGGLCEFLAIDPFWPSPARNHPTQSRRDIAKPVLDTCSHGVRTGPNSSFVMAWSLPAGLACGCWSL